MLKKLLASVLAVATVASCAYVPSALASADTTYKTATAVDYQDWKLKNPDSPATTDAVDVNIYVSANFTGETGIYTLSVKPDQNNVEYVTANLGSAVKSGTTKLNSTDLALNKSATAAVRNELAYDVLSAGSNTYVAHIVRKKAVIYNTYKAISGLADVSADSRVASDAQLLGYYEYPESTGVDKMAVLQEMTQTQYTSQAKVAGFEFTHWTYLASVGDASDVVVPNYAPVSASNVYYTDVTLVGASASVQTIPNYDVNKLTTAVYAYEPTNAAGYNTADTFVVLDYTPAATADGQQGMMLPKGDTASWDLALTNWVKKYSLPSTLGYTYTFGTDSYKYAGTIRCVNADKQIYAAEYAKVPAPGAGTKNVTYKLSFFDVDATATQIGTTLTAVKSDATDYIYTTNVEEVYSFVKASSDPATLAEYLVALGGANVQYKWTGDLRFVETRKDTSIDPHTVTVQIFVEQYDKYTVYSFADGDVVKETSAFLCDDQIAPTYYANQDGTDKHTVNGVLTATRDELGVSETATINGVPAKYAYATRTGSVINTTYKMGDATVVLDDFATATGRLDEEAYFCRAARAGDKVTLKVSIANDAKNLDLSKVTVEYKAVAGATISGETYAYTGSTEYKDGVAVDVILGEGTNIVTATVSYAGKVIGTFAPFYVSVD